MMKYENAAWRESMRLKINYNNMMKSALIPTGSPRRRSRPCLLKARSRP